MPLPKRRFSHARTRKKRTHKILKGKIFSLCPQCRRPRLSHRICAFCGYYDAKQVIEIKEKKKKEKKKP
ncbi:MAG: 50S ribosomal protein L32 [Candidatus Omnitrophota bacterium]